MVPGPQCLVSVSGMTGWPGWPEGEVCWNFYSLLRALSAFSCTWMNDRAGEITQTRRNVWRDLGQRRRGLLNTFSIKEGGDFTWNPLLFSYFLQNCISWIWSSRSVLWSFQTSFVANLCKFYLIINWGESRRPSPPFPWISRDKNKLLLLDYGWRLTRSWYHFPCMSMNVQSRE